MIEHLDLENLAGANQVPSHLDVGLAWGRIPAGMIVLCVAKVYV